MPYKDGVRISNEEWARLYSTTDQYKTGPNGENPADAPELDADTGAPKSKKKAGTKRSPRSEKAAKAAIADALGVKEDSPKLDDIDVSGLDADKESE